MKNTNFKQKITLFILSISGFLSLAEGAEAPKPSGFEQMFPFILIGFVIYFLFIRPQQRRYKTQTEFLNQIKRGDEVLTNAGIFGVIEGITDQFVILEVADNVRIRVLKNQIASFVKQQTNEKK